MRRVCSVLFAALLLSAPLMSQDRPPAAGPTAKAGTIYFVDGNRLAGIQPDGGKGSGYVGDAYAGIAILDPDNRRSG